MALTKVIHSPVPLRSLAEVSATITRYVGHVDTRSVTITCSDVGVAITCLQGTRRNEVHVFKYKYLWGEAAKEKEANHAVGEVPRCSEGVPQVGERLEQPSEGQLSWDEVYQPTPAELAQEAAEEEVLP